MASLPLNTVWGVHYLKGIGCETNHAEAIHWLTLAVQNGDIEASNKLNEISQK